MDNEYNYEMNEDMNQMNNQTGWEPYNSEPTPGSRRPKTKKPTPKIVKVMAYAVAFGLVAGTVFQATNIVGNKLFGTNQTQPGSAKVSNTELTQTANTTSLNSDVADVVKNTMPSVVSITNMTIQQVQSFFGGVTPQESESRGSGIIIGQNDTELLIVTNNHVVSGNDTLTVSFIDEESVEAQIKGADAERDLAVIAVPLDAIKDTTMDAIKVAQIGDSSKLNVGENVIAIGNALGYGQSVTTGVVSALGRELEGYNTNLIQTDAAINPGNSGGALLNAKGEVVGINSAKLNAEAVEGMGYAIAISDVQEIINDMMNKQTRSKVGEQEKGYLGIKGVDVSEQSSQMYNMPTGVYVSEAIAGGGAQAAGITKGSIITSFGGTKIDSMSTLQSELEYYKVGETVEVTVQVPGNNGEYEEQVVNVTLGKNA